ncbi:hypothetical protein [Terrisporobacter sp.]
MKNNEEWIADKCDKYDYLIAAFCGASAGLIDVFFVGVPGKSVLGNFTDKQTDKLVMKFAKLTGWSPREGQENNIASAIGHLEKTFKINYDQNHGAATGGALKMSTKNHHFKSLSHSPDLVGLFFSILDQFQGKSTFLSDGQLIRIDTTDSSFELKGSNVISKIFCGFCNWLGHIMSDMVGSSGGRGNGGRGSGVPIPFMSLFQLCDFGKLRVGDDLNTLAKVMTKVFENGYDLRFGAAMAIPVVINELMIRVLWVIKKRFYEKKEWKDCMPSKKHADLRMMLIVGDGALCLVDGADALIKSGGNAVAFVLRLNMIGWARFIVLVFKELSIRYGSEILESIKLFLDEIWSVLNSSERQLLYEYYARMEALDQALSDMLNEFIDMINREYALMYSYMDDSFDEEINSSQRMYYSSKFAEACGVEDSEIIKNDDDLYSYFLD